MSELEYDKRARTRELAADFIERGDPLGWFDALYQESGGDAAKIPWADMEPNRFFRAFAERVELEGNGRKALVVGCGIGDDAKYLHDLGFEVTAFDISPTAIEWARRVYGATDIRFETADLFEPFREWLGAFEFVLEIYTIQPLPIEMRESAIDAVAAFVAPGGELAVVTRGREDDEETNRLPWPISRKELSRFEANGLTRTHFEVIPDDTDDEPAPRFVVLYRRPE